MVFRDRTDAGRQLAQRLATLDLDDPVVLGMARGGVPVAVEIAKTLGAPFDVLVVRKLGHPSQPELGLGAIAEGGVRVVNTSLLEQLGVSRDLLDRVASREEAELERRLATYRGDRPAAEVHGRTVVVVDDGLATGFTALSAVEALRRRGARRVVLAVPVAPPGALGSLESSGVDVVCLEATERFFGISEWYADFRQVSDEEVVRLLASVPPPVSSPIATAQPGPPATAKAGPGPAPSGAAPRTAVEIRAGGHVLPGDLVVPARAEGLVVFAHGSGSGRLSPRNAAVAATFHEVPVATLLFDLLTEEEAAVRANVFDIALLAERVEEATAWARGLDRLEGLPIGFFGASTGAAAALVAAARLGPVIRAVVSRGGRPDLAGEALASVTAPTLLVVGGRDDAVLALNREAQRRLRAESRLEVIPGATHLFEEPGALEQVARLGGAWFAAHLRSRRGAGPGG